MTLFMEVVVEMQLCVARFEALGEEAKSCGPQAQGVLGMLGQNVGYAKKHLSVVEQWGRFPHRNELLGRESTAEEKKAFAEGTIPSF